ncbi:MAG TPA: S53 family serine peptidase [Candidatus Acidoferrum sp.]|jgi:kumamolisin|nr:S53 family serine peptidase [Candidatus Acidoferrum sp.]
MAIRASFGFAAAAMFALAACGGGTSSNSIPAALQPTQTNMGNSVPGQTYAYPATAPAGVRIYVHLPLRNSAQLDTLISQQSSKDSPQYHQWLTPAQFRASYGPTASTLAGVAATLNAAGFSTAITSQGIVADAPQATVERVFNVHLSNRRATLSRGTPVTLLQADKAPTVPAALASAGAQIAAFAPLPAMRPDFMKVSSAAFADNRYSNVGPYWFDDLRQAYKYPSTTTANGNGRTIGIIAACDYLDSDVSLYFGYENAPVPHVVRRPVDGGSPAFDIGNGDCDEVSLDVQQSGGSAPGATIMVYEAPDASITPSFLDMYTAIVEDNKADVVSTSFGLCELYFSAAYNGGEDFTYLFSTFHDLYRQGNAQGITFVQSSGDNGALNCTDVTGTVATLGVNWAANDTDVTGVGGTNLVTSYNNGSSLRSAYVAENAYDDLFSPSSGEPAGEVWGSGGGKSVYFPKPLYQYLVNNGASTRTVPDVAMHMGGCPEGAVTPCAADRSSDVTALGGGFYLLIGTSASSPEFAGLQAVQDQLLGSRTGNVNYLLYALAALGTVGNGPVFHNDIPGNNGGYPSTRGYNYVVGNGTPYAAQYDFDPFGPEAGNPQTPSNP